MIYPRLLLGSSLLAFGLAVGFMAGLSVSPVVASLLGVLAPIAVGLVSWKLGPADAAEQDDSSRLALLALLIGPFSIGLIGGVCGGITVRTHGTFSPSPAERVAEWQAAGLTKEQALEFVTKDGTANGENHPGGVTALFGQHTAVDLVQYAPVFRGSDLRAMLQAYKSLGGARQRFAE